MTKRLDSTFDPKDQGRVKQSMAGPFRQLLGQHQTLDGLARCFQFRVLALEAPASHFYEFLGI
jgi:hypothetical protein